MPLKRSAWTKYFNTQTDATRFMSTEPLPAVQAAIERDKLDAQLKTLERNQ